MDFYKKLQECCILPMNIEIGRSRKISRENINLYKNYVEYYLKIKVEYLLERTKKKIMM